MINKYLKILILGLAFVFVITNLVFAKQYKSKTKDGEVYKTEDVQIEITEVKDYVTFGFPKDYNHKIQHAQERIDYWQAEIIRLREEKVLVEKEAKKVKLKEVKEGF